MDDLHESNKAKYQRFHSQWEFSRKANVQSPQVQLVFRT